MLEHVHQSPESPRTANSYAERLAIFFRWLEQSGKSLYEVTARDLLHYQSALRLTSDDPGYLFTRKAVVESTRRVVLTCVIQFFEWDAGPGEDTPVLQPRRKKAQRRSRGMLRGIVTQDIQRVKPYLLPKPKKQLPKFLTDEEVEGLFQWLGRRYAQERDLLVRNRAVLSELLETGVRVSELVAIRIDGYDDVNRTIRIPYVPSEYERVRKTGVRRAALVKTGERVVVIGPLTAKHVHEYILLYRPREGVEVWARSLVL